MHAFRLTFP